MAVAILSKFMNPTIQSLLLDTGHCSKQVCCYTLLYLLDMFTRIYSCIQVYYRLQKIMICMSSDSTQKLIESMGSNHDKAVQQWKDHL